MMQSLKRSGATLLIFCIFGLAACSSSTPSPTNTPTLDLDPFRTEVAATVYMQVTHDLASTPSVVPQPSNTPTFMPTPTSILAGNLTPLPPTGAPPDFIATWAAASPVASPAGSQVVAPPDRAAWVSQSIPDDTVFRPGETFTMTWRLRNVGATTWTAAYLLRFYTGSIFGASKEIALGQEVPPGGEVDINLKMKAPDVPGNYRSDWVLANEKRGNFKEPVYLKITVALPPTATRAPAATATP